MEVSLGLISHPVTVAQILSYTTVDKIHRAVLDFRDQARLSRGVSRTRRNTHTGTATRRQSYSQRGSGCNLINDHGRVTPEAIMS